MRTLTILTALLALQLTASAEPEIKGTALELAQYLNNVPKTVTVTGEAEVRVPAHRAVLSLRVTTENHSFQEAFRHNLEVRQKIADVLSKQGISPDRIQSSRFSSTPKFGIFGDKAKSYRVENVVRVVVQDEKEFQNATSVIDAYPEVQFEGVEFQYADRAALKQQALAKAIDNAGERANIYEEKLSLKLTPAAFSEGTVFAMNPVNANYANRGYISNEKLQMAGSTSPTQPSDAEAATQESISSFGELVYTARINVDYSAQPKTR
jgi:uncharacterized protein YggE